MVGWIHINTSCLSMNTISKCPNDSDEASSRIC